MPLFYKKRLIIFVTRQNLTIFSKVGVGGVNINFSQPKNIIIEQLKKSIPIDIKNKKPVEVEVLFSLDMSFIYSSKKPVIELLSLADQVLPYSTEEAEFFIAKNKSINTIFAAPNPIKNLLNETFKDRLQIHKFTPILLMFSTKLLSKLPSKSHIVLTCLSHDASIVTILTMDNSVLDYQTYRNVEIQKITENLLQVYKTDPDFLLSIDTIITDQTIPVPTGELVKIIKIAPLSKPLEQLLISSFDSLKYPQIVSASEIKKADLNNEQAPIQSKSNDLEAVQNKKPSPKILSISFMLLILLLTLGVVIYMQFQSTKPENFRKNGTVAPPAKQVQTIIPSQKFNQQKPSPQPEIPLASQSAETQ